MPREVLAPEIDRYVVMPGQAVSYLTGKLEILRIREEARQRLGLVKPGEVVVILPPKTSSPAASTSSGTPAVRPIWQQWLSLFFGG